MNKLAVIAWRGGILSALIENGRPAELFFEVEGTGAPAVGDVILGTVQKVNRNIDAAFVALSPDQNAYLPCRKAELPREGEQVLVQVERDAVGTKLPLVTRELSLPGRTLILTEAQRGIVFSHRLTDAAEQKRIRRILGGEPQEAGFIVRTEADGADEEELLKEREQLKEERARLRRQAPYRPPYSVLRKAEPLYLTLIRDVCGTDCREAVTDDPELFDRMTVFAAAHPEIPVIPRLYREREVSLAEALRIRQAVSKAQDRVLRLPSGGELVIEKTEAMTVIDVNTARTGSKKDFEETAFRTNCEAARETAFQLRLRGISGVITIDFINMKTEENRRNLLALLEEETARDRIHVSVEGFTPLGMVEMTRRRVRAPLAEQLGAAK
ncbi:MAG: ribonuclease E/G [Oscillospiraceae bacterium]|nr:ribonuclease E/G [Oscillospiraceae bacterium]